MMAVFSTKLATGFLSVMAALAVSSLCIAAEPIPRRWDSISLEDVDPSPYQWTPASCKAIPGTYGRYGNNVNCGSILQVPGVWQGARITKSVTVDVLWSEPPGPAWQCIKQPFYIRKATLPASGILDRDAEFMQAGVGSRRHSLTVSFRWDLNAQVDEDVIRRIGRDLVRKFELYALPCSETAPTSGSTAAGPAASSNPPAGGEVDDLAAPEGNDLGVLGQSDPGFEREGTSAPSAPPEARRPRQSLPPDEVSPGGLYRGSTSESYYDPRVARSPYSTDLPDVFPPGTRLEALRFFANRRTEADDPVEQRKYSHVFDSDVWFINYRVSFSYPRQGTRIPFTIHARVLDEDGQEYARWDSGESFSIEPGWVKSNHESSWGRKGGGFWKPGTYKFELRVDGDMLAEDRIWVKE